MKTISLQNPPSDKKYKSLHNLLRAKFLHNLNFNINDYQEIYLGIGQVLKFDDNHDYQEVGIFLSLYQNVPKYDIKRDNSDEQKNFKLSISSSKRLRLLCS